MEVLAFFASYEGSKVTVSDGYFGPIGPKKGSRSLDLTSTIASAFPQSKRPPVMIIDCNSFEKREFSEKVMKHLRLTSAQIWFMTYIETVEDVFDSFNKDADQVFAPYHFIQNDTELKDINDVSDSVIPVIFVHKGKAVLPKGKKADVISVLEKLVSLGFYRNSILDMEDSLDGYSWSIISEDYPSTIPIVSRSEAVTGFETIITPYLL